MSAFLGKRNAYHCPDCGGYTVTIDVDEGVTPMMLRCRANGEEPPTCQGMAMSLMYPPPERMDLFSPPAWEWYAPDAAERERLRRREPASWDHVSRGGLMLRKRAVHP